MAGAAIGFAVTAIFTKKLTQTESIDDDHVLADGDATGVRRAAGLAYDGALSWPEGWDWAPILVISIAD